MATIGTMRKSKKHQALDAELGLIIEEMGKAMWDAAPAYITTPPACRHESPINFTLRMSVAWEEYVGFLRKHYEKA